MTFPTPAKSHEGLAPLAMWRGAYVG